jgi:hypothetical protein
MEKQVLTLTGLGLTQYYAQVHTGNHFIGPALTGAQLDEVVYTDVEQAEDQ